MTFTPSGFSAFTGVTPTAGAGLRTEIGSFTHSGGNVVAYVHSGGAPGLYPFGSAKFCTTLNQGLSYCRAGKGDIVVVLEGHTESISAADQMSSLVSGTTILGMGHGTLRPKFTFTAAAATFLLDQADVTVANMQFYLCSTTNGGVTVAAPITVSGNGCRLIGNFFNMDGDANDIATIGITITSDDVVFAHNMCVGATAAECTTFVRLTGADRIQVVGNYISAATSAVAVGVLQALTTASTNILIADNYFANNKASSQEAMTLMNACTGLLENNRLAVLDDASLALDNDGNCTYGPQNTLANNVGERGLVLGTVSA